MEHILRLSQELTTAREQASELLQENIVIGSELESLLTKNDSLQEEKSKLEEQIQFAVKDAEEYQSRILDLEATVLRMEVQMSEMVSSGRPSFPSDIRTDMTLNQKERQLYEELIATLKQANERLGVEHTLIDVEVTQLRAECARLQRSNIIATEQLAVIREHFDSQAFELESLRKDQIHITSLAESYCALELTADSLRSDLKEALGQLYSYKSQLLESEHSIERYQKQEKLLLATDKELSNLCEDERSKCKELEATKAELLEQIASHESAQQGSTLLVENLRKELDFLNETVRDFQDANKRLLEDNSNLKSDVVKASKNVADLRMEIGELKEAAALNEARSALQLDEMKDNMNTEIQQLRSKLFETKKRIVHDNVDSEVGKVNASVILEREKQNKAVYEGIINDLKTDVDRSHAENLKLRQQIEDLKPLQFKIEELDEELKIYKETAEKSRKENMKFSFSAVESHGFEERAKIEKYDMLREMQILKIELDGLKAENGNLLDELRSERTKKKDFNLEKLAVESQSAEINNVNMRLAALLEDEKLKFRVLEIEYEKSKHGMEILKTEADKTLSELHSVREVIATLTKRSSEYMSELEMCRHHERELENEVGILRQLKDEMAQETGVNRTLIASQRLLLDAKNSELDDIMQRFEDIRRVNETNLHEVQLNESRRFETRHSELQRDLENALSELESRVEQTTKLEDTLDLERENVYSCKLRITALEERLHVCKQELEMYRSLDIYRVAKEKEMKKYRSEDDDFATISDPGDKPKVQSAYNYMPTTEEKLKGRLSLGDLRTSKINHKLMNTRSVESQRDLSTSSSFRLSSGGVRDSKLSQSSNSKGNYVAAIASSTRLPSRVEMEKAKALLLSTHR